MISNKDQRLPTSTPRFSTDLTHETEAFRQLYSSILALTGDQPSLLKSHKPTHLLAVNDVTRYGILNFAFESAHLYFSSPETSNADKLDTRVFDIAFACARARMRYLKQFTLLDKKSFNRINHPSRGLFICLAYLHNLWVLHNELGPGKKSINNEELNDIIVPLNAFCAQMNQADKVLSLEDALVAQMAVANFLKLCYAPEEAPKDWTSPFDEPLLHYLELREKHRLLSILLDQVLPYLPITRFWMLPAAPLHFDQDLLLWTRKSQLLFSRRALPVLMSMADYLANRIFNIKEEMEEALKDGTEEYRFSFNPFALDRFSLFVRSFGQKSVANLYPVYFRLLFYYYLVQNHVLAGLQQFLSLNDLQIGKALQAYPVSPFRVGSILYQFLEDGAAFTAELPLENKRKSDPLIQTVHSMVNRLADQGMADKCAALAIRVSIRFNLK